MKAAYPLNLAGPSGQVIVVQEETSVAQSLAAHGSDPQAATLVGRRVSRIAVHPARQREGIGQRLIEQAHYYSTQCDYLSVSFGYTSELWRFWQRCGFVLVRMGNHREASSGCYTAMALLPISEAGKRGRNRTPAPASGC